jgi:menaquinone-specific isochorismate synthase
MPASPPSSPPAAAAAVRARDTAVGHPAVTTAALTVRTIEVEDPGDLLVHLPDPTGVAWVRDGDGLVGWGQSLRITPGPGPDRMARAADELTAWWAGADVEDPLGLPGTGPVAFGSFTFDPRTDGSVLTVPAFVLGRRRGRAWLTVTGPAGTPLPDLSAVQALPTHGRVRYAGSSLSEVAWLEAVADAVHRLSGPATGQAGQWDRLAKVVLARDLHVWSDQPLDGRTLAHRLAARFPTCWTFAVAGLVGATPELLIRRTHAEVTSLVLAGSAPRGADAAADERLGAGLLASRKDRAEHDFAVESLRERLAPRCADLHVDDEPHLLQLANVQHLATEVHGHLRAPAANALALAGDLHPTAAVCGTPTAAALDAIRELEHLDRGRYAGPVGWVDARGDGEWGIALRCAEVTGARARLFAGAGIVAASRPEAELEETRIKLRAMQSALEA